MTEDHHIDTPLSRVNRAAVAEWELTRKTRAYSCTVPDVLLPKSQQALRRVGNAKMRCPKADECNPPNLTLIGIFCKFRQPQQCLFGALNQGQFARCVREVFGKAYLPLAWGVGLTGVPCIWHVTAPR